jgi:hypothetical protein
MDNKKKESKAIRLYGTNEVCSLWGISRWRLYELVKNGDVRPIINMGKGWKFDGSELREKLLERL